MSLKLILTSGGSQLLTQIAFCIKNKFVLPEIHVIYIGENPERLKPVLKLICECFEIQFKGVIRNLKWPVLSNYKNRIIDFCSIVGLELNPLILRKSILKNYPILKGYNDSILILPIRHKILSDILVVNAVNAKEVFITADGVVNHPSIRTGKDKRLQGLKTPLNIIPLTSKIYSPSYLTHENKKLGDVEIIEDEILTRVFDKTFNYFDNKKLFDEIKFQKFDYLIFSQHLSLSKYCSEDDEIEFYKNIIFKINKSKKVRIAIKFHPRDTNSKIQHLVKSIKNICIDTFFMPQYLSAVPVEIMSPIFKSTKFITVNSSAVLPLKNGNNIECYVSDKFTKKIRDEVFDFASLNDCKLIRL